MESKNVFKLNIVPGTLEFVLRELNTKFSGQINITETSSEEILFESSIQNIDEFRTLKSALHITKNNSLTRNLFRRDWKKENVPAGLNPSLAYILCMVAEISEEDIILDPFCGAGTIGITAGLYFKPKKVLCSDLSGKAIDYSVINLKESKLNPKIITFFRSNVSMLKLQKDSVSKVITNMPFGIRVGRHDDNLKIYKSFADKMRVCVKSGGRLVLYTTETELLRKVLEPKYFELINETKIEQGKLFPSILVYKKV